VQSVWYHFFKIKFKRWKDIKKMYKNARSISKCGMGFPVNTKHTGLIGVEWKIIFCSEAGKKILRSISWSIDPNLFQWLVNIFIRSGQRDYLTKTDRRKQVRGCHTPVCSSCPRLQICDGIFTFPFAEPLFAIDPTNQNLATRQHDNPQELVDSFYNIHHQIFTRSTW